MARNPEGWRLDFPKGIGRVRFTHAGRRYSESTRERDPHQAARVAALLYAQAISGRSRKVAGVSSSTPLDTLVAGWVADYETGHDPRTAREVLRNAKAHWLGRWRGVNEITTESAGDYMRERLREITRKTVQKELSMLRVFLAWCDERGLGDAPTIKSPPARAVGVRSGLQREHANVLTEEQIARILAELPELSSRTHHGQRARVRDYFVVLWETGLRPTTVQRLESPLHYRRGADHITITDRIDKARWGRDVPITDAARDALDRSVPAKGGPIFGTSKRREALWKAATTALGPTLGAKVSRYDFRHSRLTAWGERTGNLVGLQHLAGHTSAATTARYLHASRRAAEAVLSGFLVVPKPRSSSAKEGN